MSLSQYAAVSVDWVSRSFYLLIVCTTEALHSLPPSPQPTQVSSRPPQSRVRPSATKRKRRSVEKRH
uniref:Secreted protein n=1 Tax=Heterorhabditis bacteriophora TaxID=37862 RepID=A0A1I7WNR0_HETBA